MDTSRLLCLFTVLSQTAAQYETIVIKQKHKVAFDLSETADIECRVLAYPKPEFQWFFGSNTTQISSEGHYEINTTSNNNDSYLSVLKIKNIKSHDYGENYCKVQNSLGTIRPQIRLKLKGAFESPRSLNMNNIKVGPSFVTLNWKAGFDKGLSNTKCFIRYKRIGGQSGSSGAGQQCAAKRMAAYITMADHIDHKYGRELTQTLADGTVVSRKYAPHLIGNQVASISVTGPDANGVSKTWELGTQTFDCLGRVTKRVSGGRTTSYRYQGASPVPSKVTLHSGKTAEYTYIPEKSKVVSSMKADGIIQTFNYDKKTGKPPTADEASAKIQNIWSQAGQMKEEAFLHNEQNRKAKHIDVTGKQTQYSMDPHGRVISITDDSLTVNPLLGRLSTKMVRGTASTSFLTTVLVYDNFGREITRTITDNRGMTLMLAQTWLQNGLLAARNTKKNGTHLKKERYDYDNRNWLVSFSASGSSLPVDVYAHQMTRQTYRYDTLNNLTLVKTTLSGRSTNTVAYSYQNDSYPTQLTTLTNTHEKYPKTINLSYDVDGRMTLDEAGRTLTYDVMGCLISVSDEKTHRSDSYSYDASNRLINRNAGNNDIRELFYRGAELVNEVSASANKETRLIKTGYACLGISDTKGLTPTAGDKNDSLLWSEDTGSSDEGRLHVSSPYGSGTPDNRLPGFNGERADPVSGTYHLGNGYRAYNPILMRFNYPDSLSPFGAGGINSYAYCAGDPINHTDPSGHLSWQAITGIIAGSLGIGLAVFTAGSSIAAAGGVMGALSSESASSLIIGGLGVASDITGIVSGVTEVSKPEASVGLRCVSLATGLTGLAIAGIVKFSAKFLEMDRGLELPKNYSIYSHYNPHPPTKLVKEGPKGMAAWHKEKLVDKAILYASNSRIRTDHVIDAVHDLRNDMRKNDCMKGIRILSGAHGDRFGHNWMSNQLRPQKAMPRIFQFRESKFYNADSKTFGKTRLDVNSNSMIKVIDIGGTTDVEFARQFASGDHVILAHCYSRNDCLVRNLLNLEPVPSYIKQVKPSLLPPLSERLRKIRK